MWYMYEWPASCAAYGGADKQGSCVDCESRRYAQHPAPTTPIPTYKPYSTELPSYITVLYRPAQPARVIARFSSLGYRLFGPPARRHNTYLRALTVPGVPGSSCRASHQ